MERFSIHIRTLTPTFSYGVHNAQVGTRPEIRVPSVRGMLRWWAEALLPAGGVESLFGGAAGDSPHASRVVIRLEQLALRESEYKLLPHPCGHPSSKKAAGVGTEFTLNFVERVGREPFPEGDFFRVLNCWLLLGALGGRSNRGAGSFSWLSTCARLRSADTEQEFQALAEDLLQGSELHVAVLPAEYASAEEARIIASDTVAGGVGNNALGSIRPRRVPSPLKFRVVELRSTADSARKTFRMVAVWDGRGRPGQGRKDLRQVIDELADGKVGFHPPKKIGHELRESSLYRWAAES